MTKFEKSEPRSGKPIEGTVILPNPSVFFYRDQEIQKQQTTNNYAESYNSKLGCKKVIGSHPNVYLLVSVIKEELGEAHDDGDSAALGIEVVMIV